METIQKIEMIAKAEKKIDEIKSEKPEDETTFLEKNATGKFKYEDSGTKQGNGVSGN